MERLAFFALFLGWISLYPVHAKGLLKPVLQQEDKDLKSAFQEQVDPFKHFAAEPEVSNALVVASNTSENLDIDTSDTTLVVSSVDCSDMKNHAAAMTGLLAAGATLATLAFPDPSDIPMIITIVAGVSTGVNGLTNYIDCDESSYKTDWERVKKISEQVYKTQSATNLIGEMELKMESLSTKVFFREPANELDNLIDDFETLIDKYIVMNVGYQRAEVLLMLSGYVCDLYMLSLMKSRGFLPERQGDPDPESSIEGYDRHCSDRLADYKSFVDRMKDYMDTLLWMNARREFLSIVTCDWEYKGSHNDEYCKWGFPENNYCKNYKWKCTANYGGIPYEDDSQEWRDCSFGIHEMKCDNSSIKSTRKGSELEKRILLVENKFKPKYQKWYDSVHKKWEALYEIHETLSKTTDTIAEQKICGTFEKPLCFPRFIPSKDLLNRCCDPTNLEFKCGQLEGTCDIAYNTQDGGNRECKPGYKCVSLRDIRSGTVAATQEEKDYIVDRAKWYSDDTRTVCFKSGETLPVYKDKDLPKSNRFLNDPCDDSSQCGKDLVCKNNKCNYLYNAGTGERMRDSSGNGGKGYACIDNSDCAGTDRVCEERTHQCWVEGGLNGRPTIPTPMAKAAGDTCDESTECDVGHCCHEDTKTCVRNSKDGCMSNTLLGAGHSGATCEDSSDCGPKNGNRSCCMMVEGEEKNRGCWTLGSVNSVDKATCLPDPLRGGRKGIECYDSSDCVDNNCCFEENNQCWESSGLKDKGKKCLRDPYGGGLSDLHMCTFNSDCASGSCQGGICKGQGGKKKMEFCLTNADCDQGLCQGNRCRVPIGQKSCVRSDECESSAYFPGCCVWCRNYGSSEKCYEKPPHYDCSCIPNSSSLTHSSHDESTPGSEPGSEPVSSPESEPVSSPVSEPVSSPVDEPLPNPTEPSPSSVVGTTEAPCCENGENLISKILHVKSDEGGEHTMGLKTVIQKVLM